MSESTSPYSPDDSVTDESERATLGNESESTPEPVDPSVETETVPRSEFDDLKREFNDLSERVDGFNRKADEIIVAIHEADAVDDDDVPTEKPTEAVFASATGHNPDPEDDGDE